MALPRLTKIWLDGEFVDYDDATIHVMNPSLHHGYTIIEGMRVYPTTRGSAIFQHRLHTERMFTASNALNMTIPFSHDEVMDAAREVCRINGQDAAYLRTVVFLGQGSLSIDPKDSPVQIAVGAWPLADLQIPSALDGLNVHVSSWRQSPGSSMVSSPQNAVGMATAGLARAEAVRSGYDEAVLLNQQGRVSTATSGNIFTVRDGVLHTPPVWDGAPDGITRAVVADLASDNNIPLVTEPMQREDLYTADEAFIAGTTVEIAAIQSVDGRTLRVDGPVTSNVKQIFEAVVHGREPRYDHMLDYLNQR